LAFAIVLGSISSCKSIDTSFFIPPDSSVSVSSENDAAKDFIKSGKKKSDNKDYQGAISDYNEAIRLNPKNATAYFWRGSAKSDLQRIPIKRATDRKIKTITGLHSSILFCGGFEIKVL
jgi:tetratricopeptide (TPR) repeat protein